MTRPGADRPSPPGRLGLPERVAHRLLLLFEPVSFMKGGYYLVDEGYTSVQPAKDIVSKPTSRRRTEVDFYTVARWDDGQIVEENLMYDLVSFLHQIGISK